MTRKRESHHTQEEDQAQADEVAQKAGEAALKKEALDQDIDSILNDIDEVLEHNAEEFVRSYVQKGGQ